MPQIIQPNWLEKYPIHLTETNFAMHPTLCWPQGAFFSFLEDYAVLINKVVCWAVDMVQLFPKGSFWGCSGWTRANRPQRPGCPGALGPAPQLPEGGASFLLFLM